MADSSVKEAQERFQDATSVQYAQRRQIAEDLAFSDPSNPQQWDSQEKLQRETDPGGARPCLTIDQLGQYVSNVSGQVEQRPPSLHALPVADGADQRVAEALDGHFRHIEYASRASQHYARALLSAARVGVGYLIIRPEYSDRAMGFQEPRISSESNPLRVCFDPWSTDLDGSDANFGFLLTPISFAEFERRYGAKTQKASFGESEQTGAGRKDDRESVMLAEEWYVKEAEVNMVFCVDPQKPEDVFALAEDQFWERSQAGGVIAAQDAAGRQTYRDKTRRIMWRRMSGAEILTEEREYPADSIGIVPVYGYIGDTVDGLMTYCGIPRRARIPQQAYNYHVSEVRAIMSLAPKAPWILPLRALGGDENLKKLWDTASAQSRAYLPYQDLDEHGAVTAPSRTPIAVNLQNHIQGALQAKEDIQAAIGMYQANLGAPSNETSGVAIDSRKQQGEASTAHFPSHLGASLTQVGKIILQMIPRLTDTRRQFRMLSIDSVSSSVLVDPKQQKAVIDGPAGLSINPNIGRYDVRVVVGSSFSTQRQQAQQAYTEMNRANPQMLPAIAPLWAKTLDVPHADKLSQVLTAMAPDPVKAILQPEQQESVPALQAKIQQLQQALQEAIQHAHDAQQDADEAHQQLGDKSGEVEAKNEENAIKAYDAMTKRWQAVTAAEAQSAQLMAQTQAQMMAQPDPDSEPPDMTPEEPEMPEGPSDHEQEVMNGQEHLAQLIEQLAQLQAQSSQAQMQAMGQLIKLVQAPRKRIPVRDAKTREIQHVQDIIDLPTEGGVQ